MGRINSLYESLEKRFCGQVQIATYNLNYDDLDGIRPFIDRIYKEGIKLPAVLVDDELVLAGYIDEAAIMRVVESRGVE